MSSPTISIPRLALPPHQLIFNAIGDADLCAPALKAAARLTARTTVPVINDPRAVMKTGRIDNARRLGAVPGVVAPRTMAIARDILAGPDGVATMASHRFAFPLLLRSPGYHTGRNFIIVEQPAELSAAAAGLPGDDLLVIEYLDARGTDGNARKYRVMMIGGKIYPLHLAISRKWKVHYFTSDMADKPDHRSEEARFLATCRQRSAKTAMAALQRIQRRARPRLCRHRFRAWSEWRSAAVRGQCHHGDRSADSDERWAYRRTAISTIIDAVVAMIMQKSTQARPA